MSALAQFLTRMLGTHNPGRRALMVLGMHRSGTSFLTGSLQQAGLQLGEHSAWNPHNTRGNRENPGFVAFHEELLAARGKSWDDPPEGAEDWTTTETDRARALVKGFGGGELWGFKDPRALLFAQSWQALLPGVRFVGIFRHPTSVSRSLEARGAMPAERARWLWRQYNERLLRLHEASPFPLLCFDDDEQLLHRHLNAVLRGLRLRELGEERFWDAGLRHHRSMDEPAPEDCAALYTALRNRSVGEA